jgi:hypothetical protein
VRGDPVGVADRAELQAAGEGETKRYEAHVGSHDDSGFGWVGGDCEEFGADRRMDDGSSRP